MAFELARRCLRRLGYRGKNNVNIETFPITVARFPVVQHGTTRDLIIRPDKGFNDQAIKMRSGHRSAAVQNYKQPIPRMLQDISDSLQPPKPQASCTSPPATTVKCDTTECIPTDCPTSPSQPAAAPTERKPSSRRDNVLTVVVPPPPPGIDTISLE